MAFPKCKFAGDAIVGELGRIRIVTFADAFGRLLKIEKLLFPGLVGAPLKIPEVEKVNPDGGGVVVEFPHVVDPFPPVTEN